jgi:hypothetical protein
MVMIPTPGLPFVELSPEPNFKVPAASPAQLLTFEIDWFRERTIQDANVLSLLEVAP